MSITPFNSVGGYSTGLTGYTVIDAVGGVSAAGGTFSALTSFVTGISASGATFAADISVNTMTVGRGGTSGNSSNTAIGAGSPLVSNSGTFNTAVGNGALTANTTGGSNTAVGRRALFANTTGASNVGIGPSALGSVTAGSFNTAIGPNSLTATRVSNSTAVGAGAIQYNSLGSHNTALGAFAGSFWGEGATASMSSKQMNSGTGGVYIGYYARGSTLNQSNEIVIGMDAVGLGSNTAVIGATSQTAATVYGLFNAPGGVSAAGGTFSGDIAVNGGVSADAFILAGGGIKALTGTTYTFLESDNGKIITMNNASGITAEVPSGLPTGFNCTVIQLGSGRVGFTGASGVTLNSYGGLLKISGQHGAVTVVSYSSNVYNIAGTLST